MKVRKELVYPYEDFSWKKSFELVSKKATFVDRLVEAGYIVRRTTDDVTYYDATPQAKHYKKLELLKVLEPAIKAASEGITTAAFEFAQKELL